MDLSKLKVFQHVAEKGSITAAQENLDLSISAISRNITALEKELGTPLFQRKSTGLFPTDQGKKLLKTVHRINSEVSDFELGLVDAHEQPTGNLTISCPQGFGNYWLLPKVGKFCEQFPKIKVKLIFSDPPADVSNREADVAIYFGRSLRSEVVSSLMFMAHFGAFASASYLAKFGKPTTLDDLYKHRLIAYGSSENSLISSYAKNANWLISLAKEKKIIIDPWLTISSIPAINTAAINGLGIACLPTYLVQHERLASLLREEWKVDIGIYLSYLYEMKTVKKVAVFRQYIMREAHAWDKEFDNLSK